MAMNCPDCGAEMNESESACRNCGKTRNSQGIGASNSSSPPTGSQNLSRHKAKIAVTVAAVIIAIIVLVFYLAATVFDSRPPYPSQATSLSEYGGGVVWTRDATELLNPGTALNYSELELYLQWPDSHNGFHHGITELVYVVRGDYHDFTYESGGPGNRSVGVDTTNGVVWTTFWFMITDSGGNEVFDAGDSISIYSGQTINGSLVSTGFQEDVVYSILLNLPAQPTQCGLAAEYQFAFHDGEFYSWSPDGITIDYH